MNARDRFYMCCCVVCICVMAYIAINPVSFTLTLGRAAEAVVEVIS